MDLGACQIAMIELFNDWNLLMPLTTFAKSAISDL